MIVPSAQYLLVEICEDTEREEVTTSGIILTVPKQDREDLVVSKAKVIESSSKLYAKEAVVYFNYFAGNRLLIKGKDPQGKDDVEYLLVHEEDVLAQEK